MKHVGLFLVALLAFAGAFAQDAEVVMDSAVQDGDSLIIKRRGKVITAAAYSRRYQPRKALLYSAVVPGMGQIYNKKYWKLPLVYGGFYALTTVAFLYNDLYKETRDDLFSMIKDPTYVHPKGYTEEQLRAGAEFYRRQRDFFLILDGLWYILQLVDAHVDAHLREFDLNPQLKVTLSPNVQQNQFYGQATGLSLTFKF